MGYIDETISDSGIMGQWRSSFSLLITCLQSRQLMQHISQTTVGKESEWITTVERGMGWWPPSIAMFLSYK